jgi:hypothetical protein
MAPALPKRFLFSDTRFEDYYTPIIYNPDTACYFLQRKLQKSKPHIKNNSEIKILENQEGIFLATNGGNRKKTQVQI